GRARRGGQPIDHPWRAITRGAGHVLAPRVVHERVVVTVGGNAFEVGRILGFALPCDHLVDHIGERVVIRVVGIAAAHDARPVVTGIMRSSNPYYTDHNALAYVVYK